MNCIENENKIVRLFEQELEQSEKDELLKHIESCKKCESIFDEYNELYNNLDKAENFQPDNELKESFTEFLQQEEQRISAVSNKKNSIHIEFSKHTLYSIVKYAAILVIGLIMGSFFKNGQSKKDIALLQNEISETKNMVVLAMLKNESSSSRIQAVGYTQNIQTSNEVIKALIYTFEKDNNVSVRLAALNALYNFKDYEHIQNIFIRALKNEQDPRIQIRLIDIMVDTKEEKAIPELYKMLQENDLNKTVKNKAEEGIGILL
jgi:HEAT repeats